MNRTGMDNNRNRFQEGILRSFLGVGAGLVFVLGGFLENGRF
jgi:hypothetical protein